MGQSNSRTEVARLIGYNYRSLIVYKKINELIEKYNIDISHLKKLKRRSKFKIAVKICPACQTEFET